MAAIPMPPDPSSRPQDAGHKLSLSEPENNAVWPSGADQWDEEFDEDDAFDLED